MRFRFQNMALAVVALAGAGCATAPCIVAPAGSEPVGIEFGDGIALSIDGLRTHFEEDNGIALSIDAVQTRLEENKPILVFGRLENHGRRRWDTLTLEADLTLAPVPDETTMEAIEANDANTATVRISARVYHMADSIYGLGKSPWCLNGGRIEMCRVFSANARRMPVELRPDDRLKDGICRRVVSGKVVSLKGEYWLRAHFARVPQPPIDPTPPSVPGVLGDGWVPNIYNEDEHALVALEVGYPELMMVLENRSLEPMHVDWKSIAWVDSDGAAMPLHLSLADSLPGVIPPGAHVNAAMTKVLGRPFFKRTRMAGGFIPIPFGPEGEAVLGQTFGIHIPLAIGDKPHPLYLRFRVQALTAADVRRRR
jgi:hypothetical protein